MLCELEEELTSFVIGKDINQVINPLIVPLESAIDPDIFHNMSQARQHIAPGTFYMRTLS